MTKRIKLWNLGAGRLPAGDWHHDLLQSHFRESNGGLGRIKYRDVDTGELMPFSGEITLGVTITSGVGKGSKWETWRTAGFLQQLGRMGSSWR